MYRITVFAISSPKSALDETFAAISFWLSLLSYSDNAHIRQIARNTTEITIPREACKLYIPCQQTTSGNIDMTCIVASSSLGRHMISYTNSSKTPTKTLDYHYYYLPMKLKKKTVTRKEQTLLRSLRGHTYLNFFYWKL